MGCYFTSYGFYLCSSQIEALDPIIKAPHLADQPTAAEQIRRMLQVFINARKRALPSSGHTPREPTVKESQESQDDYPTMDIDYDDPELLAALNAHDSEVATQGRDFTNKEEKLGNVRVQRCLSALFNSIVCSICLHFPGGFGVTSTKESQIRRHLSKATTIKSKLGWSVGLAVLM